MEVGKSRGFSIVESVVVLAVASVLLTLGVPSFARMLARSTVQATGSELTLSLAQARMRAVADQAVHSLCASRDGASCLDDTRWERGWIVFRDPDESGVPAPGSIVARIAIDDGGPLVRSSAGRTVLSFRPDGSSAGSNVTLLVCNPAHGVARRVIVSNVGRTRTEPLRDGDAACTSLQR